MVELEEIYEMRMADVRKRLNSIGGLAITESNVNYAIMDKLNTEVRRLETINRCLKNVVRVPRLYTAFHREME